VGFIVAAIALNLVTIYLLRRDLSMGSRYSFIFFPGLIALLGAGIVALRPPLRNWQRSLVLSLGLFGSIFVLSNQAFLKPFQPEEVAARMLSLPLHANVNKPQPMVVAVAYHSSLRLITGLSYALEMEKLAPSSQQFYQPIYFVFLDALQAKPDLRQQLLQVPTQLQKPFTLWLVGQEPYDQSNLGRPEMEKTLRQQSCTPDIEPHFVASQGTVFRPYRCS
jgi:hypothetical protein